VDTEHAALLTLGVSLVVLAAIVGVRLAARFGLPGLLLYLGLGLVLGRDGLTRITFDDAELASVLGYAALVIILAEGGLTTRPSTVRPVLVPAAILATLGVALSIFLVALPLAWLTSLDLRTAMLIGAVMAPTDAAAVFTVARGLRLPPRLQTLLEGESGFNDAPVVVLVVLLATADAHWPVWAIPLVVLAELLGGVVIGLVLGFLSRWLLLRLALPASGLYPVAVLALLMGTYGLAVVLHTSGFAAVYVSALVLAASQLPHRRVVLGFVEGLAWAVQIGLFIMLGLLADPSALPEVAGIAALAGLLLLFVARPASVWASLAPFLRPGRIPALTRTEPMPWQWAAFISWAGLRGAVPIIFATIPLGMGTANGSVIFNVTMLLVIVLTLVQSPTMPALARRLGLVRAEQPGELTVEAAPLDSMQAALLDLDVPVGSRIAGTYVSELPLPDGAVISLVVRSGHTLVPDRNTRVKTGDRLLIVTTEKSREKVERALQSVSRSGRLADWASDDGLSGPGVRRDR
jgi:cell volume regulation protein A